MLLGFVMLFGYALIVWLVFFKFKWMQFSYPLGRRLRVSLDCICCSFS